VRLQVSGQFWLLQVLLLAFLCAEYSDAARPETWRGWFFLQGGRFSCAASLSLLPGLLCLACAALLRSRRALSLVSGVVWALALFLVYVDTRIYGIFRYHFNGLVWNVLTTPGADEAVHITTRETVTVLIVLAALVPVLSGGFLLLWSRASRRARLALPTPHMTRPGLAWKLLLVPNMCLVAGVYAWADLTRDPHVMAFARVYPVYPRVTVKRFAQRYFGVEMKERPSVDLPESGILLDYPRAEIVLEEGGPRPNVLVIVIDSLRADMLGREVMPHLSALADGGRVFRDHLSSGNATRFGLFGLLYGLHGSYWKAVYDEHRSPVLVDALLAHGYDFRVLTSASMDFPEFRSTAWVRVEAQVEDRLPAEREGGRDDGVARRFEEWLGEREAAAPFFAFLLLDAPHQSYSFPEECARFRPYLDRVAYTTIDERAPQEVRGALFNRYRNSVHYADQTTGRILAALAAHGLSEDTLVVVTGDHGEEFFESGVWGHTSNFTRPQTHVPLVLAGAGVPPGEERRATSHVDLPATILELLGADPGLRAHWSLGANLLDPPAERARVISGWDKLGVHVADAILEVPMASYGGAGIAVYDLGWQRRFDDSALLEREGKVLGTLALECRRFLR
jgi:membrane-anchored protein YejM (alkaline phosphatase superfamily)